MQIGRTKIKTLETLLQAAMPDAKEVETHAAQFGKMEMRDEKMKMSGKSKM